MVGKGDSWSGHRGKWAWRGFGASGDGGGGGLVGWGCTNHGESEQVRWRVLIRRDEEVWSGWTECEREQRQNELVV